MPVSLREVEGSFIEVRSVSIGDEEYVPNIPVEGARLQGAVSVVYAARLSEWAPAAPAFFPLCSEQSAWNRASEKCRGLF